MKFLFSIFTTFFLIIILDTRAQSEIIFRNVYQTVMLTKPFNDSAYAYNFEYLSARQLSDLSSDLYGILKYKPSKKGFVVYDNKNETNAYDRNTLRRILVSEPDSTEVERFDVNGISYIQRGKT